MDKIEPVIERIEHSKLRYLNFFLIHMTYRAPHYHNDFEIVQGIEGLVHVRTATESYDIGPGEVILFNPNEVHELSAKEENCILLCIQIDVRFCRDQFPSIKNIRFLKSNLTSVAPFEHAKRMIRKCFFLGYNYYSQQPGHEMFCMGDAYLLFGEFLACIPYKYLDESRIHSVEKNEERIRQALFYIHEQYQGKISLSSIAREQNLSMSYLSHLFKKHIKMSFQEYVNALRFEHALFLLKKTDMKVLDICMESGFSDSKYLNRRIMDTYHISLTEFRKKVRTETAPEEAAPEEADSERTSEYVYPTARGFEIIKKHFHFDF